MAASPAPPDSPAPPVARSVLVYACAFAVAGATPFLLLPVLTRYLTPHEFGEVTSFLMLAAMIGNLAGLSSHGFVSVRYFKSAPADYPGVVTGSLAAVAVAHGVVALLIALLFPELRKAFDLPFGVTLFAVVAGFFLSVNLVFLAIFQSAGRPMLYLRSRVVQCIGEVVLCVALIHLFAPSSGARIYSYAAAMAASAAVGWLYCARRGYLRLAAGRLQLKELAAFGLPMLPHIAAGTAIVYLDRVMVSSLLGVDSLGIYMVAMQIGMAMIMVIEPLNKALAPWLFSQLAKDDAEVRLAIVRKTYLFYALLVAFGIVVAVAAMLGFDAVIGERYAAAKVLIPWMVGGFVLQGMYYTVVNYLFFAEKTGRLSFMSSFTAFSGCLVSYALVSQYGLLGAGVSFLVNNAILFALVWFAASKALPMPWRLAR